MFRMLIPQSFLFISIVLNAVYAPITFLHKNFEKRHLFVPDFFIIQCIVFFTASITGTYRPKISRIVDPEMPGTESAAAIHMPQTFS